MSTFHGFGNDQIRHKAVFFDLGDTLFVPLSDAILIQNLEQLKRLTRLEIKISELLRRFRETRSQVSKDYATVPFFLHTDLVKTSLKRIYGDLGREIGDSMLKQFADLQRDTVVEHLRLQPDCIETLQELRNRSYKLAIVSNIDDDWFEPLLKRWNLYDYFDVVISSEHAQSCKPDSTIFLMTCSEMGVQPGDTVFVGDSEINDVQGGNSVGMSTVHLNQTGNTHPPTQSNWQITQLSDLLKFL